MMDFKDKHVLITGAAMGIGYEIARQFVAARAKVSVFDRDKPALQKAAAVLSDALHPVTIYPVDVADADQVAGAVAQVEADRPIDILINNAGICPVVPFLDLDRETWQRTLDVNLSGTFYVAQAVCRYMAKRKRGVVINMASKNGLDGEFGHAHYNASKAGVILLTKTMALELAHLGIRTNAVCPGYVRTPINYEVDSDEFVARFAESYIPLNRVGQVSEIAPIFLFLAGDAATYINGQTIVLDGGQLAGQKPWAELLNSTQFDPT